MAAPGAPAAPPQPMQPPPRTFVPWQERLKQAPWAKIGIGAAAFVVLVAVVPPFRNAFSDISSKVVMTVARPFAPSIKGFDQLPAATRVLASDGSEIGTIGSEMRQPVALKTLPAYVPHAVLAAEDANFYHHAGVDPPAVFRALFNSIVHRTQGGSTITQQLAKLNYTGSQHTVFRKLKEVLYASRLEAKYSKDQLLERYLNQVYFGNGAYGIGEAAQTYFGVDASKLTPAEAAMLAGKIQAPSRLDPYTNAAAVKQRRDHVLTNMAAHGWLTNDELTKATSSDLDVKPAAPAAPDATGKAPQFAAYVSREAATLSELGASPDIRRQRVLTGGYTIQTTMDSKAYDAAVEATRQTLGAPGDPTTAIASVQPGDGAIRVLFGGLDPSLQFDPASQGKRQAGSSFKPYVYLAMLRAGIDPRTTYDTSSPQTLQCQGTSWTVRNYEGEGGGPETVDDALAASVNVVFAQVMTQVGPPAVAEVAQDAGIAKDEVTPAECAMALGGLRQGVSPLEQAAAYATFAAKGVYAAPYSIATIRDRDGHVVYEHGSPKRTQAFKPEETGVLTAALEGVVQNGTGTAAQIGRPLAGKTGTTENYGDAWFIGYVPQMSTAVWVGYPDGNRPMRSVHGVSAVTGGTFPAQTFSRYMRSALAGVAAQPLYTASPDQLHLRGAPTTTAAATNTSTAPSTTSPSTTSPFSASPSTTRAPATTVTSPPTTRGPAPTPTFFPLPTPTTAPKAPGTTVAPPTTTKPTPTTLGT